MKFDKLTQRIFRSAGALATAAAVGLIVPQPATAEECDLTPPGVCTRTSVSARRSCRHEAGEEYHVAIGHCRNETSARPECRETAVEARAEARDECEAVCEARQLACDGLGQVRYDPEINPDDFLSAAEMAASPNPYYPLKPGMRWVYEDAEEDEIITVTVTDETVEILGIECAVVHDIVEQEDEVIEDTLDWYAQDTDGNVWYMGELSYEMDGGLIVSLDGSWQAGVNGAKPGIIMFGNPAAEVTTVYRQEFLLREAEDIGEVLAVDGDEESAVASCGGACVVTADTVPPEPDALEHKYYANGVGMIVEVKPATGQRVELIEFTDPTIP